MLKKFRIGKTLITVLAVTTFIFLGTQAQACDTCDAHADKKAETKEDCGNCGTDSKKDGDKAHHGMMKSGSDMGHGMIHGKVDADGKAKGATMGAIYSGSKLYTCPMHAEIITDNGDAKCPICNMNLSELDKKAMKTLLNSDPKGCPMDPVVMQGHKTDNCSICKMNLRKIEMPKHG